MNKKEFLENLSTLLKDDNSFRFEAMGLILEAKRNLKSNAEETLRHLICINNIQFNRSGIFDEKLVMIRELDRYIIERIGYSYIYDLEQSDYRIIDAISKFCSQTTRGEFQDLQFHAMAVYGIKLIDIFDLKEKLSAKLNKV
jgi:hypothetical protein|nr:MAG TPA: hypothetical protein [Bacteriophage sp.]